MSPARLVLIALALCMPSVASAAERVFPISGSGLLHGGVTAIGGSNGGYLIAAQDVDGNAATTDSSSEVLTLPVGATIRSATLVWNQDCILPCTLSGPNVINTGSAASTRARLVAPDASVHDVVADRVATYAGRAANFDIAGRYAWADVTTLVASEYAGGAQRFAVGNIHPAFSGSGLYRNTTWAIFVVYEDPNAPLRAIAVDIEGQPLPTTTSVTEITLTIANVQLPSANVSGTVVVHAADGQASIAVGENLYIDSRVTAQALTNTANPLNNQWNHSISHLGVASTTARPDPRTFDGGAAGIDLDTFDITGKPTPGANKVDLIVTTTPNGQSNQEFVVILAAALAVDVNQPDLTITKSLRVLTPDGALDTSGVVDVGDRLEFGFDVENVGNDTATFAFLDDLFPAGTEWVPGSLRVNGEAVDEDDPTRVLLMPNFAMISLGEELAVGAEVHVSFELELVTPTLGVMLSNAAGADFLGLSSNELFSSVSNRVDFTVCGNALREDGEACDDGNGLDADACRDDCTLNDGPEVCDDGLDNDGDALADGFDDDCQPDLGSCTETAPAPGFSIRQDWTSSFTMSAMLALVAGDLDGDGRPELVGGAPGVSDTNYSFDRLYVVSGAGTTTVTRTELILPGGARVSGGTSAALGDIFTDRPGIEVAVFDQSGRVQVFAADGTHLATSPAVTPTIGLRDDGDFATSVQLADLDRDGTPEIIVGNGVVRAALGDASNPNDGTLVVAIALDRTLPRGNVPNGNIPAVRDLLSVADCDDAICDGIELAAGGTVYAFDVAGGVRRVVRTLNGAVAAIPAAIDGSTAIADLDLDGELDVVFADTASGGVARDLYAWTPRTGELVYRAAGAVLSGPSGTCWGGGSPASTRGLAGSLAIAEVYDERAVGFATNLPEVFFTTVNAVRAYNPQAGRVWELSHSDCSSVTGITAFDFNGDGVREVVLNDEQRLRIVYGGPLPLPSGVNASRDWASFASGTSTLTEQPIVVDVDADGQAEIVTVSGAANAINGTLKIFGTNGLPWRATRGTWNQRHYNITNVNDDLTIPAWPQSNIAELPPGSGRRPLNLAGAQAPAIGDLLVPPPLIAAADVVIDNLVVHSADEDGVSACGEVGHALVVGVTLVNAGDAALPAGTPLAFFADDPFVASAPRLVGTYALASDEAVAAGASLEVIVTLDDPGITTPTWSLWVVANDRGDGPFPIETVDGSAPECVRGDDNAGSVLVRCGECGNGVIERDETCDAGESNGTSSCGCTEACVFPGTDVDCDDGLFCTGPARCDGVGLCAPGTRDDATSPCDADRLCDEERDRCVACVDASDCDDGSFCNGPEACNGNTCEPGIAPCIAERCDDAADSCAAPRCGDGILDAGESCDAGEANGTTTCGCSTDCEYPTSVCDDGLFCTTVSSCDGAGACAPGVRSDASSPCARDALCFEDDDTCLPCIAASDCDDGSFCNGPEACNGNTCEPGVAPCIAERCDDAADSCAAPRCGDGILDAGESCDAGEANGTTTCGCSTGCEYPTSVCDDGMFCTTVSSCDGAGACAPGVRSDASSPCARDALCVEDDDTCLPCIAASDCDDGSFCNGPEACNGNTCEPGVAPCIAERCDDAADTCAAPRCGDGILDAGESCDAGEANGTTTCGCSTGCEYPTSACDDGLFCTTVSSCDGAGACAAGVRTDASSPCARDGLCVEDDDTCLPCIAASDCDDGSFCNGPEACNGNTCEPGIAPCSAERCDDAADTCAAPRCGDGILDAGESCDAGEANGTTTCGCSTDCEYPTSVCDDGLFCTTVSSCDGAGACAAGVRTDANSPCARDGLCVEGSALCLACVDASDCDDGVYCNGSETCSDNACGVGVAPCSAERCNEETNVCAPPTCGDGIVDAGEACDAGDDNGVTACGCSDACAWPTGTCEDGLFCTAASSCDGAGECVSGVRSDGNSPCARDALCDEEANACAEPRCGDDFEDPGEGCDDGNVASFDGCDSACRVECTAGVDCYCDLNPADIVCGECVAGTSCYCDLVPTAQGCQACEGPCPCDVTAHIGTPTCPSCVPGDDCACDLEPEGTACAAAPCVVGVDCYCDQHPDDAICGDCGEACVCADPATTGSDTCQLCEPGFTCFCDVHPDVPGCRDCRVGVDCPCDAAPNQTSPMCVPVCVEDVDCGDGAFCSGVELCVDGACVAGTAPCGGELCDEVGDACVECLSDADCDDGDFCSGVEACTEGACVAGSEPCSDGETCVEAQDACIGPEPSPEPSPEVDDFVATGGGGCDAGGLGSLAGLLACLALSVLRRRKV